MTETAVEMTLSDAVRRRVDALRDRVVELVLDAAIFHSSGLYTFLAVDYVRYVSGFKTMGPNALVVVPRDGAATLLISPSWDLDRARTQSPIEHVVACDDFAAAWKSLVGELNLAGAKVAMPGYRRLTKAARDVIVGELTSPITSFDAAFDEIAAIRDPYELDLARRAAAIADRAHEHMVDAVRVGMAEYELAAEVVRFTKSLGADDNFLLMASSQANTAVRPVNDRRLDVGDFIIGEVTPSVGGQFVQITRTIHIGEPTEDELAAYDIVVRALDAGIAAGREGVTVGTMVQALDAVIADAGYPELVTGRRRGHGLGLGSVVPGDLTADNETVLRTGMIFTLHPNQYLPATGYLMAGQPLLVAGDHLEHLSGAEVRLEIVEG